MIRPQMKKQKEVRLFREGIKKGDKVLTVGGIYGRISEIQDTTVLLEIADGVRIKVDKAGLVKDNSDVAAAQSK
jgi:preprotein translocase subunit YajC